MLRLLTIAALALVAASFPARADSDVEITMSSRLQTLEARIDNIEQLREKRFRKNRHYDRNVTLSNRRFASARYQDVAWANESLVPELGAYGVKTLLSALVNESLRRAGVDRSGTTIRIHLDTLRVSNHALAMLSGSGSYVRGSISLVDAASGEVIRTADIRANLVVDPTADLGYKGPDFMFEDTDPANRMGPALAYFVMEGLGKLYEGTQFPRPVTLVF
ncbi:MAG: hypothetical protein IID51_12300 [Proteobacteria bacterium]|nr:hypothetical protein [Pseudomonadota bacterium]